MTGLAHRPSTPQPTARFGGTEAELQTLRTELEQHRRFRVEQLRELSASRETEVPTSPIDQQSAVTLALRTAAGAVLADIDDALSRIQDHRYGGCEECGAVIPLERLQAWPMIRWCGPCQHAKETTDGAILQSRRTGRPQPALDIVEEWGHGSFPASDPPANW